ncbi:hypothetical protein PIROE2DRAFT_5397 [Piromyces sp. E2]|nr:hypothetical protein PIROE2DRAFT_5397 [Piromyces sp. E2]|eukprot:OUM67235.1 hypothetical protein PIROE2DRAFT_5397 [Piromyces sp. E2]
MTLAAPIEDIQTVDFKFDENNLNLDVERQSANPKGVKFDEIRLVKRFNVVDIKWNKNNGNINIGSQPNKKIDEYDFNGKFKKSCQSI